MQRIIIDFEDLRAGDIVGGQFSADGVTIRSASAEHPPMVFDSDNPTGGDRDLATDENGNILILSEDGDRCDPDDNAGGGTFVFEFDAPVHVERLDVIDIEGAGNEVRLFDADGVLIAKLPLPVTGNGGVGTLEIDVDGVARMDVVMTGSGAIDNVGYRLPDPDGIVSGTEGDDLIDRGYDGDSDGDRVDNGDAILLGHGPHDDMIEAGAGHDTVHSGAGADRVDAGSGDDTVYGGRGDDVLDGGTGEDTIRGNQGDDTIIGGAGADTLIGGRGSDTFIGGTRGDVVRGGEDRDGSDIDVLNLSDVDYERIEYTSDDRESGRVIFSDGSDLVFTGIEKITHCFTPGARIATSRGERRIEDLREGDKIVTRDNGLQEIRWIGSTRVERLDLEAKAHLRPILIKAGALGGGLPERDMMVSPNHRMLMQGADIQLYFQDDEVLVAAKHLIGERGIRRVSTPAINYIHFMFDRHEVVLSDGAWTESFQPGTQTLEAMGSEQQQEIYELFPELATDEGRESYCAARQLLRGYEAELLLG
ncbi:Hint domain-containing protein [Aestuariibius insulae]|uniref:Hint domain-containing protein n=1 Tax=Aestuariibius insulae TaxID=2058287 RepID=UPI00345EEF8E